MLSVNIPVFNIEVSVLAEQLVKQAQELGIDFEIRIYDDGSNQTVKTKNREVSEFPGVIYTELKKNLGRAAIRNRMGYDSQGRYLLFIDADSRLVHDDYLKKFMELASPGCVLCGGTAYLSNPPSDKSRLLRWVYGSQREAVTARQRNRKKSFIITSNNFLIDREVFNLIHFREDIGAYGHEDTLLGYDLFAEGIHPVHIDNPVEHTGLEDSATFLNKSKEALNNLHIISCKILSNEKDFNRQVTFIKRYNIITTVIPTFVLRLFYKLLNRHLEKNLTGSRPRMIYFDLYKLLYYSIL